MAKFYGKIGYASTVETAPGVYGEQITSTPEYSGDVIKNSRKLQASTSSVNDNINITNQISILSDPFANSNFHNMRYVEYMGAKWKVIDIEVQFPRLILSLGGVYNG